jgi:flagellar hook assembly protein FlgD
MDHSPQLTITDLIDLQLAVDIACTRGAYQAAEMKQIGTVYEKLATFLEALKTQLESQDPTEPSVDQPQGD